MEKGKYTKSWKEKLTKEMQPKIVEVPEKWALRIGHGRMLVPSPQLINSAIKKVKKGKLATVNRLRDKLARDYAADMTCPLTTGIFLNIAANAAEEEKSQGKNNVTPYWRILKEGGMLNHKFPGGEAQQAKYLGLEGFEVVKRNAKWFVKDYEDKLAKLN